MNTLYKNQLIALSLIFQCAYLTAAQPPKSTESSRGIVGRMAAVPGQVFNASRNILGAPFYHPPFFADFIVTKTTETISGRQERCFSIQITTNSDNPLSYVNQNILSEAFLKNNGFTYNSKLRREPTYETALLATFPEIDDQRKIRASWIDLEKKLEAKYISALDISTPQAPLPPFRTKIKIGSNVTGSKFFTEIYNDVADFASTIGISMPRVETSWHYLLTHKVTKAIGLTALIGGLGIFAYQNREKLPSLGEVGAIKLSDIGSAMKAGGSAAASQIGSTISTGASTAASGVGTALSRAGGKLKGWVFAPSTSVIPPVAAEIPTPEVPSALPGVPVPNPQEIPLIVQPPQPIPSVSQAQIPLPAVSQSMPPVQQAVPVGQNPVIGRSSGEIYGPGRSGKPLSK